LLQSAIDCPPTSASASSARLTVERLHCNRRGNCRGVPALAEAYDRPRQVGEDLRRINLATGTAADKPVVLRMQTSWRWAACRTDLTPRNSRAETYFHIGVEGGDRRGLVRGAKTVGELPATRSCGSHPACSGQAPPEAVATRAAHRAGIRKNSLGACASSSGMAKPKAKVSSPSISLKIEVMGRVPPARVGIGRRPVVRSTTAAAAASTGWSGASPHVLVWLAKQCCGHKAASLFE